MRNKETQSAIDPATGELRAAGTFLNDEWRRLVKQNPELATAIIEIRRAKKEGYRAKERRAAAQGTTLGVLAGVSALTYGQSASDYVADQARSGLAKTNEILGQDPLARKVLAPLNWGANLIEASPQGRRIARAGTALGAMLATSGISTQILRPSKKENP